MNSKDKTGWFRIHQCTNIIPLCYSVSMLFLFLKNIHMKQIYWWCSCHTVKWVFEVLVLVKKTKRKRSIFVVTWPILPKTQVRYLHWVTLSKIFVQIKPSQAWFWSLIYKQLNNEDQIEQLFPFMTCSTKKWRTFPGVSVPKNLRMCAALMEIPPCLPAGHHATLIKAAGSLYKGSQCDQGSIASISLWGFPFAAEWLMG